MQKHHIRSTLDDKYAYSQSNLDPDSANRCNFKIISGNMTGTYRFQTGFHGLTDMLAEFQKAMDYILKGNKNIYCFHDDNLINSKRSAKIINNVYSIVSKYLMKKILE